MLETGRGPGFEQRVAVLARDRRLAVETLLRFGVGWRYGDPTAGQRIDAGEWIAPERDASGQAIGVHRRLAVPETRRGKTTHKLTAEGSARGLVYADDWQQIPGPVIAPEGLTDSATLDEIGIAAIGRPGARSGAEMIAAMVVGLPADREIVVLGENDEKPDGSSPGREGAIATAQQIADAIGRPVGWTLPPAGFKDVSDWWRAQPDGVDQAEARSRLLDALLAARVIVTPRPVRLPEAPLRVEPLAETPATTTLDEYRREMQANLAAWADRGNAAGRVAVLAAPAGTGKTTGTDRIVVAQYDTVVYAAPTYANLDERRDALAEIGRFEVAAFPRLDADTCQSFTEEQAEQMRQAGHRHATSAARVQALGLNVRQIACKRCPLAPWNNRAEPDAAFAEFTGDAPPPRRTCQHHAAHAEALAAPVRLATSERIRRQGIEVLKQGSRHTDGRRLLVIDEQAAATLFPTVTINRASLVALADALEGAALRMETDGEGRPRRGRRADDDAPHAARAARSEREIHDGIVVARAYAAVAAHLAGILDRMAEEETFGVRVIALPLPIETSVDATQIKNAETRLAEVLLRSVNNDTEFDSQALDLVRRVRDRRIRDIVAHVQQLDGGDDTHRPGGARIESHLIASWNVDLDDETDVLILDATVDVPTLADRIGRPVERLDPPATLPRQTTAIQLPAEITGQTSPRKVAAALESALAALPDAKRVGVILLKKHRKALFPTRNGQDVRTATSRRLIPDDVLRRIATREDGRLLIVHFGEGEDRGSNLFLGRCDALVILGTPRPKSVAVARELVRRGQIDAAVAGSDWGRVDWHARRADGTEATCTGRGYASPEWSAAAAAVTRAPLHQATERARTYLADGLPVVVVSTEPTGLPVVDALPAAVPAGARYIAETVRRLAGERRNVAQIAHVSAAASLKCPKRRREPEIVPVGLLREAEPVPSRDLYTAVMAAGPDGRPTSRATAERLIRDAVAAGIVTRSGSTSATTFAVPPPPAVPDAEEVLEIGVAAQAEEPVDDFDEILARFDRAPPPPPPRWIPASPPPWTEAPAWSPHLPTGTAA